MLKASDLRRRPTATSPSSKGSARCWSGARRVGLVGLNGAGKSTLRLLAASRLQSAAASRSARATGSAICRRSRRGLEPTIDWPALGAALGEVWRLHGELERLETRLRDPVALAAYGDAQGALRRARRLAPQAQLDGARDALGSPTCRSPPCSAHSAAARRARALLAGVLLGLADGAARRADESPRPRRARVAEGFLYRLPGRGARRLDDRRFPRHRPGCEDARAAGGELMSLRGRLHRLPRRPAARHGRSWHTRRSSAIGARGRHRRDARLRAAHRDHGEPGGRPGR